MKAKTKWINPIFVCLCFTIIIAGCAAGNNDAALTQNGEKDELVIHVGYNIADGNYDPCTGFAADGFQIFHSALYKFNKSGEIEPDLALGHTVSDDGTVYTYQLRDDILFSDGEPLTAHDVAFTYVTARDSGSSIDLSKLASASALDDYTVVFTLTEPWSTFVSNTAQLGIVPEHAYDETYREKGIGAGPFKVVQLDIDQQLIIEPNEHYYGQQSPFKRITILNLDEQVALATARSGVLDLVLVNPEYLNETIPGMDLIRLQTIDNRCVSLPVIPYSGELGIGNDVTSDPAIRAALNIGINRAEIIDNALNGAGIPAYGRVDAMPWNSGYTFEDNRPAEAAAILEAAGWIDSDGDGVREKDGVRAEFSVAASASDLQRYQLAVALSESAAPLGIRITAQALSWEEGVEASKTSGFVWGFGDYNPSEFYYWYHSDMRGVSYYNPSNYSSALADELIDKALHALDMKEATTYWQKLQYDPDSNTGTEIDIPYLWLVNIDHTYFVRQGLDIGDQMIHPHGHGMPVIGNLNEWSFTE